LSTQPPGPVILLGHSMGGLLAAEAATHPFNNTEGQPTRIVGMVAFDTPYLGMHPHVVVSGIASLFRGDKEDKKGTDTDMNDTAKVTVVDGNVTDDWDAFKKNIHGKRPVSIPSGSNSRLSSPLPSSPPRSNSPTLRLSQPFVDRAISFLASHSDGPLLQWARKHADDPFSAGKRSVVEHFQFGSCMFDPSGLKDRYSRLVAWKGGVWVNYWTQTVSRKGLANADPAVHDLIHQREIADNDSALIQGGIATDIEHPPDSSTPFINHSVSPSPDLTLPSPLESPVPTKFAVVEAERPVAKDLDKARQREEKSRQKALKTEQKRHDAEAKKARKAEKERNKVKHGRHFIVLPTGLGQVLGGYDKWEKVLIGGVEDEVAAHCGLFIRSQNLDYDGLVERVGQKVLGWCETI
ncbi:hypothetical protein DXG03_008323, partial [Asterophora parasitica]